MHFKETPEKLNWPKSITLILVPFIWLVSLRSELWHGSELRFSLFVVCFHKILSRFFLLDRLISSSPRVLVYHLHRFWQRLTPVFTAHLSWLTIPTPEEHSQCLVILLVRFQLPCFWLVFWRVRSTNATFYASSLRSNVTLRKVISFMIEWTHQERECYLWDSNFYLLLSTAGVVLAEAPTPAVHGSSHGQTSFSGYLPPHVDLQHHSSPDIYTHHHNTPSTIFTPERSWRYP